MITEEKILGFKITDWVEMIDTKEAKQCNKALKYYDGLQEEEMEKLLSCPNKGRKDWRQRGVIPRWRNLTQMIVEKSGKLFKDQPPNVSVYGPNDVLDESTTLLVNELLTKSEWLEIFNNHDSLVRLLKTSVILTQFDVETKSLVFESLHRGNCAIITDTLAKKPLGLIFQTSEYGKIETYRIITLDEYIDLIEVEENGTKRVSISSRVPNPYGIVPITMFHDTRLPRSGIWNVPGMDLITINEMYNLHLTDSEQAISWSKFPKLIMIDCDVMGSDNETEYVMVPGEVMPRLVNKSSDVVAGPSKAIALQSNGTGNASIEYKTPEVNIEPLDNVVQNWVLQFSYDWSVRLNVAGEGSATSGFQVVVEELPNKELRQQRAKMMQYSFARLFDVIRTIVNAQYGRTVIPLDTTLFIEFNQPELPVDDKQNEEVWDLRIAGNRASVIDYLMIEQGYTKEEAMSKYEEIKSINSSNVAEVTTQQNNQAGA